MSPEPPTTVDRDTYNLVLVGGGLQNGLIALSALHRDPACRIAVVEADSSLGGNHTWCVHAGDVSAEAAAWFAPLVVQRWAGYDVCFPTYARTLDASYAVISSEQFARVVGDALARSGECTLLTGVRAIELGPHAVTLDNGRTLQADLVVDARGPQLGQYAGGTGYQKFVGLELQTEAPHGLTRPIIMDATCDQADGYRFFYMLPFTAHRLLVEETRFSHSPTLDLARGAAAVNAYATARFGRIIGCVRQESGVLPMPWSDRIAVAPADSPLVAGYRGGYFHPATGYSLPAALRVAEVVGNHAGRSTFRLEWERFTSHHRAQAAYARQLNRLLFSGFAEIDMWGVFDRFYRLPEDLIERFYAMSLSVSDRARILIGKPPRGFSSLRALRAMRAGVTP